MRGVFPPQLRANHGFAHMVGLSDATVPMEKRSLYHLPRQLEAFSPVVLPVPAASRLLPKLRTWPKHKSSKKSMPFAHDVT